MKRCILLRLRALALLCALALGLFAPARAEDGTVYLDSAGDLYTLAEHCSYDAWSRGKTVVLRRNISLGGAEFSPIPSFGGVFEGNGYTISGLNVTGSVSPAGLFGIVAASGTVRDLRVEGTVTPGGDAGYAGGVAGINRGLIENCTFTGTVEGAAQTGGIAGENAASAAIRQSTATGGVYGKNMTGGIAGVNRGTITGCTNRAYVNTRALDRSLALDKLELTLKNALDVLTAPETYNLVVDSGGIAGYSEGVILSSRNYGSVGYPHLGYNVGGIAGRSSGHIASCANEGSIYGRREVGGITGMAEPHVTIDLKDSSIDLVRNALSRLSAAVERATFDADSASDTLSARLSVISRGVSDAQDRADALTDSIADTWDEAVDEIDRAGDILDTTLDLLDDAMSELSTASQALTRALNLTEDAMRELNPVRGTSVFDELDSASKELRSASDLLTSGLARMREGLAQLRTAMTAREGTLIPLPDADGISAGVNTVVQGADLILYGKTDPTDAERQDENRGARRGVLYHLNSAAGNLSGALTMVEDSFDALSDAVDAFSQASGHFTNAVRNLEAVLNYLQAQERLKVPRLGGSETEANADALSDSLRGISDNLELLNQESKASSDLLLEDLRAVNARFTELMNIMLDVVEDAGDYSASDRVKDTSDKDIDAVIDGKLLLCANSGAVSGDYDVGGVTGAMMVFNELDPERDVDSLSVFFRRRYELKCILQRCENRGAVSAKQDNAGLVCGNASLGVISECEGYGSAESERGAYVGGIAGLADNVIRRCWAKCALSGARYVGGITGGGQETDSFFLHSESSLQVEGCRSMVELTGDAQYAGAISGSDIGKFADNRFVSDTLAGLDRVSYIGQAEPVSYETLLEEEGLPWDFRSFSLRFVAGDETVRTVIFRYGDTLDASAFPALPQREGYYARWDRDTLENLRFDTTVTAVYEPRLSALDASALRSASRPAFLIEGGFDSEAVFEASPAVFDFDVRREAAWRVLRAYYRTVQEQWVLTLPDDGAQTHTVHYLPPEGVSGQLELYALSSDGTWSRLETGEMGSYLTFSAPGKTMSLTVASVATPWWIWALVGVLMIGVAVLLAELLIRKKGRKEPQTEAEREKLLRRARRRRRLRIALIAFILALSAAIGALLQFVPRITDSITLYGLLRNYASRPDIDMELTVALEYGGVRYAAQADMYATEFGGRRVFNVAWQDLDIYLCDGRIILDTGKAIQADGLVSTLPELVDHAANLYRDVDVTVQEENNLRIYHAAARGDNAGHVLETLLPAFTASLPQPQSAEMEVLVTDGELTSLLFTLEGESSALNAELRLLGKAEHTLPQGVRSVISAWDETDAQELTPTLQRISLALLECATRDPLSAEVHLTANSGPLLMDSTLRWQRSLRYDSLLSRLTLRGSTLYYTDALACTEQGTPLRREAVAESDTEAILRLICRLFLLSEPETTDTPAGYRIILRPDAEGIRGLARLIAPETGDQTGLNLSRGTVTLTVENGVITEIAVLCAGALHVVRSDVDASVAATILLDRASEFSLPPRPVLSALDLDK